MVFTPAHECLSTMKWRVLGNATTLSESLCTDSTQKTAGDEVHYMSMPIRLLFLGDSFFGKAAVSPDQACGTYMNV